MRHRPALYRESAFDRLHRCSGGSGRIRTREMQHSVGKTIPLHYGSTPDFAGVQARNDAGKPVFTPEFSGLGIV